MHLVQVGNPRWDGVFFDFVFDTEKDARIFYEKAEAESLEVSITPYYEQYIYNLEDALLELADIVSDYWFSHTK